MDRTDDGQLHDNTTTGPTDLGVGMSVVDSEGEYVGTIKAVGETDFLVDLQFQRDLHIPIAVVSHVTFGGDNFHRVTQVVLRVRRDEFHYRRWAHSSP